MTVEEQFEQEFKKVFTDKNVVKACGREECIKLIELARKIDNEMYYGSTETGLMNTNNIIKLHERIMDK